MGYFGESFFNANQNFWVGVNRRLGIFGAHPVKSPDFFAKVNVNRRTHTVQCTPQCSSQLIIMIMIISCRLVIQINENYERHKIRY
jgi:hypothetical protein